MFTLGGGVSRYSSSRRWLFSITYSNYLIYFQTIKIFFQIRGHFTVLCPCPAPFRKQLFHHLIIFLLYHQRRKEVSLNMKSFESYQRIFKSTLCRRRRRGTHFVSIFKRIIKFHHPRSEVPLCHKSISSLIKSYSSSLVNKPFAHVIASGGAILCHKLFVFSKTPAAPRPPFMVLSRSHDSLRK